MEAEAPFGAGRGVKIGAAVEMTNEQLYLVIGAPMLFSAVLIGLLMAYMNAKFDGMNESVNRRFDAIDRRFDDMRDLWRS